MAKKTNNIEFKGPTMVTGPNPPNPSDEIFQGRPLPVVPANAQPASRPFSIPVRPTLHYRDGLDGAAETVTVPERRFFSDDQGQTYGEGPKYRTNAEDADDHGEFGAPEGANKNKYSKGPDDAYTTNGVWIRGT